MAEKTTNGNPEILKLWKPKKKKWFNPNRMIATGPNGEKFILKFLRKEHKWKDNFQTDDKSNHPKPSNNYLGELDENTRKITKVCSETYALVHHINNLRKGNPWLKKLTDIVENINIPGGKMSEMATKELMIAGKIFAKRIESVVNGELVKRLDMDLIKTKKIKKDKISFEKIDIATGLMIKRAKERYGRKFQMEAAYIATSKVTEACGIKVSSVTKSEKNDTNNTCGKTDTKMEIAKPISEKNSNKVGSTKKKTKSGKKKKRT